MRLNFFPPTKDTFSSIKNEFGEMCFSEGGKKKKDLAPIISEFGQKTENHVSHQ